ncbi:hypothetical protein ACIGHF_00440 [Stenotrophomonas sp. NPDC077464]|uniref:hypothetical protein n=1 Tax=unclassified Stenotrophomonas TaxID=196198 RepID=UPI0037D729EB
MSILLPLLLAFAGIGVPETARAADCPNGLACDQGKAFSMCKAAIARTIQEFKQANPNVQPKVQQDCVSFGSPRYDCAVQEASNGGAVRCRNADGSNSSGFHYGDTCEKRPDWNGPYPFLTGGKPTNGSVTCNGGCQQAWYSTGDGYFNGKYTSVPGTCNDYDEQQCKAKFGYSWNSALSACEPDEGKCPNGQAQNSLGQCAPEPCPAGKVLQADGSCKNEANECPAGQIKSPDGNCLPGEGQCAAGEVRGKDGTCKKDADGDGEPDAGEEGEGPNGETADDFSGGDSCNEPPSCSGSPIMCGQARIQWRIDCNTRKNRNIAGGMCTQPPVCTGEKCDALEYSGLLMQWRTACAVEKLASSTGTGTGSNPDLVAIRNALTGNAGTPDLGDAGDPAGAFSDESGYGNGGYPGEFDPDTAGFGYSRTCPTIPALSFMGQTINVDTSAFCNWMILGGQFVLIIASLLSLRIISSGGTQ